MVKSIDECTIRLYRQLEKAEKRLDIWIVAWKAMMAGSYLYYPA